MRRGDTGVVRAILALGLSAALYGAAAVGVAAPQDDHRAAMAAYAQGDIVAAMQLLRAPAAAGHAPSQALLAFMLDRADFPEEAVRWYREAARQGHAVAISALGGLYATGRGVAKDEKAAWEHFSKAADLGDSLSIEVVADAYLKGRFAGIELDAGQAAPAVRRAAERGHLASMEALAQAYTSGRLGLSADGAEASAWRERVKQARVQRKLPPAVRPRP